MPAIKPSPSSSFFLMGHFLTAGATTVSDREGLEKPKWTAQECDSEEELPPRRPFVSRLVLCMEQLFSRNADSCQAGESNLIGSFSMIRANGIAALGATYSSTTIEMSRWKVDLYTDDLRSNVGRLFRAPLMALPQSQATKKNNNGMKLGRPSVQSMPAYASASQRNGTPIYEPVLPQEASKAACEEQQQEEHLPCFHDAPLCGRKRRRLLYRLFQLFSNPYSQRRH